MNFFKKISLMGKVNRWRGEFGEVNRLLETGGGSEAALEILTRILKIESNSEIRLSAILLKVVALYALGRYQETVESVDEAIKIDQEFASTMLYQEKANALRHLGKFEEAIELYNEILKTESNNITVLNNKGLCLNALGKYQESINNYDEILEIEPCNITVIGNKELSLNCLDKVGGEIGGINNCVIGIVKIKVPGTNLWVLGEQKKEKTWDIFIMEPQSNRKNLIKKDGTTKALELFFDKIQNDEVLRKKLINLKT